MLTSVGHWAFVGRADDLARLTAAATDAAGRGLVLSGHPGIGKSRLLREAVGRLPAGRFAVVSATSHTGSLVPTLPADCPAGLSAAGRLRWAADDLQAGAGDQPLLLAVDDAHRLDPPSAALVHLLVRDGATLFATVRTGEPVPAPLTALWTEGLVGHAELGPLTVEESLDLLDAMLGAPVEAASAHRLAGLAAGNPLLLRELVTAARAGGEMTSAYGVWRWTGRLHLAPSLTDLIDARIGRIRAGAREVLELVAFGEPLGLALLRAARPAADVEQAEERGLIRIGTDGRRQDVRLTHPLYGEMIRRTCPVTRSQRLLATLAGLVERTGARRRDDLLRTVVWRLDSGTGPDSAALLDAAGQALRRSDLPLAGRLAAAAGTAGAGYDAADLLATVLLMAGRPAEALAALDHDGAGSPARWITARQTVAFWGLGRPEAADELAAAPAGDPADRARMRAVEALMRLHRKQIDAARTLAAGVLADPAADPAARAMAECVPAYLTPTAPLPTVTAPTEPALQYTVQMTAATRVGVTLDLAGIDDLLAAESPGGSGSGWAYLLRAEAAWLRGRTEVALRAAEQACAALAALPLYDGCAHAVRAYVAAIRGDTATALESLAVADQSPGTLFYPGRALARVWITACGGDVPGAVRRLDELVRALRADGFAGYEVLALHDLARLGRPDLAAGRMQALLATVPGGPAAGLLLRHARAAADGSGDGLLAVARDLQAHGYLTFAAEAAATAVRLFRSARDPQALAAGTLLADVLARCQVLRTPALLIVQPALTDRERQVAELAADGAKSREIAERLFLSPRTVENHLQRVYTKLGVNGREALAPALRSLPQH